MGGRHSERYNVNDDDDDDVLNPKSKSFCRACIDSSALSRVLSGKIKILDPSRCPLDSVTLGRAAWSLLHTMAAYYPENPTMEEQLSMVGFIRGFSQHYPCDHCAYEFRKNVAQHPPKVDSRNALDGWLCMQHNLVNLKLNKPIFDCSNLRERWRDGWKDGSCDI